ncbi:plasmid stability/partitioning protein [Pseudomonas savastanoi]|uniref:Uncharacterized protein n=1 Tax=Pseudomonas savastanoi pv. glycinea TaxID=318 RepID=A0A3M3G8P8_PSESG|nr:plasmid stability/partitioning protein [Pseudomonas savastanoi]RMM70673.1 hypothetical protein ALQ73_200042 [Pseudomonas savastanoi pv. glycinea]
MDLSKIKKHTNSTATTESKSVAEFIVKGDARPNQKQKSTMVGFRFDENTLNGLNKLTTETGKTRITIIRAPLLAFESLSDSEKARFLIQVMT